MTGNDNGQKGAVYNDIDAISSGLASIEFVMSTGGGRNGGADGFALTIIDILDASELQTLLEGASAGGGLGYGVAAFWTERLHLGRRCLNGRNRYVVQRLAELKCRSGTDTTESYCPHSKRKPE